MFGPRLAVASAGASKRLKPQVTQPSCLALHEIKDGSIFSRVSLSLQNWKK
jgi:hypothetical protein